MAASLLRLVRGKTLPFLSFYTPPTQAGKFGLCGQGPQWQANIQQTENPSFTLMKTHKRGGPNHWPELEQLAKEANAFFQERASRLVQARRKDSGEHKLEITLQVLDDGLYLIYAIPTKERGKEAPSPYHPYSHASSASPAEARPKE